MYSRTSGTNGAGPSVVCSRMNRRRAASSMDPTSSADGHALANGCPQAYATPSPGNASERRQGLTAILGPCRSATTRARSTGGGAPSSVASSTGCIRSGPVLIRDHTGWSRPSSDPAWREPAQEGPADPGRTRRSGPGPTPEAVHRATPIRVITEPEFEAVAASAPKYYKGRRRYISAAATAADDLIGRHGLRSALELGPHLRPLIVGADVMDRNQPEDLDRCRHGQRSTTPRRAVAVRGGQYDLFVALQVFEHIVGGQDAAFLEVRRVARHAVMSLPIDWVMKDPTNCHHMISERARPVVVRAGRADPDRRPGTRLRASA